MNSRTQEILELFRTTHNYKYEYPNLEIANLQYKIDIICPIHGLFVKYAYCHLRRKEGCPKCKHRGLKKDTHADFLKKLKNIHGDNLPFKLLSEYKGSTEDIKFIDKYGECITKAGNLTRNSTGSVKTAVDKTKYMIAKFKEIHGDKYDYSKYEFLGQIPLVTFICKKHGEFRQSTKIHCMGSGCSKCAKDNKLTGYSRTSYVNNFKNKPCIMYALECNNSVESFIKFGITSTSINLRYRGNYDMPYSWNTIFYISTDAESAWNLELEVKRKFKNNKYIPEKYFKGITECLKYDIKEELLKFLKQN